jgi:hypothetical protein
MRLVEEKRCDRKTFNVLSSDAHRSRKNQAKASSMVSQCIRYLCSHRKERILVEPTKITGGFIAVRRNASLQTFCKNFKW